MQFSELRLAEPLLKALQSEGYITATPIQAQAIPHALEGKDVLGSAQTGTGKTAAFALPILQRLGSKPASSAGSRTARALILAPTRELATQIADSFRVYGQHYPIRTTVIFGGVNQHRQTDALRRGIDVIIATPGRLLDLMNQGYVDLRQIEVLVLDEADRMLDMGFIHDIRKITAKVPAARQTLLFSATMPKEIRQLADSLLRNPANVQVAPVASTADKIDQSVYFVEKGHKAQLLAHLVNELPMTRAIVFTKTKHGADRVVRHLHTRGIKAEAIHGNKSQNARERALQSFRAGRIPLLVATDIASRGIDVDDITHVVNYDITHEPETYVHRIGRTARAGASGSAISFCDREERHNLKAIERLIKRTITVRDDQPKYSTAPREAAQSTERQRSHAPRNHASHGPRTGTSHRPQAGGAHGSRGHAPPRHSSHAPAKQGSHGPAKHSSPRQHETAGAARPSRPAHAEHATPAAGQSRSHPVQSHRAKPSGHRGSGHSAAGPRKRRRF